MILIENLVEPSSTQVVAVIKGMRNPKNSWEKLDTVAYDADYYVLGKNDAKLMKILVGAGQEHRKFLRMLNVIVDITAPLYWWKEFDTYKVGTVSNSCSTMHKIQAKEFTRDDFSCEHLNKDSNIVFNLTIEQLNCAREKFIKSKDKDHWWQLIQLLPSSYNQKRTISINYETLLKIYFQRQNHKLDEWLDFCEYFETVLPMFVDFVNAVKEKQNGRVE